MIPRGKRPRRTPTAAAAATTDNEDPLRVKFVIEHDTTNPDRPSTAGAGSGEATEVSGNQLLHLAVSSGEVGTVRLLLQQSLVEPNVLDERRCTPLMVACSCERVCVETVRLLLAAGGDPTIPAEDGFTPMHAVTQHGHTEVLDMLHENSPGTINFPAPGGETPLFMACYYGQEAVLSRLLTLGAVRPDDACKISGLTTAVHKDLIGVVRVLLNQGMNALGGKTAVLRSAMYASVRFHRAKILSLLRADGEPMRSALANTAIMDKGMRLLHYAAGFCCPDAVSVLLEAGADETARDAGRGGVEGRVPLDMIGEGIGLPGEFDMDRGKELAIRRMLQRGPAYRARSWAWPAEEEGGAGDGGGDPDPTDANNAAAAAVAVRIFRPASGTKNVIGTIDRWALFNAVFYQIYTWYYTSTCTRTTYASINACFLSRLVSSELPLVDAPS